MKKTILGVAAALAFAFPFAASAAVSLNFLTIDGATNATVSEGSTVTGKVTYDITSSTDVESMSWELVGSGLPQTCVDVPDRISDGTFTASFDVDTTGATEGTWDVRVRSYGDDGADVSNLCETTDQSDSQNFTDRVTVTDATDDNQDNNGNVGGTSKLDSILAAIAALVAKLGQTPPTPPAPPVNPVCQAYAQASTGASQGVRNDANVRLQGFLLSQGASIPALAAGASFGFYGPQTASAVSWFLMGNHC